MSEPLIEGFFIEVLSQTKLSKYLICYVKLFSVTLHTNVFFTNEPCVARFSSAVDVVVFSALVHLNAMLWIDCTEVVWFCSSPTPISCFIGSQVYTGFCFIRPAPFIREVP